MEQTLPGPRWNNNKNKNERREADDTTTRDTASPQCTTHDDHDHSRARGPTSTPSLVVLRREAEPSVEGLARVDGRPAAARGAEQRRLGLGARSSLRLP